MKRITKPSTSIVALVADLSAMKKRHADRKLSALVHRAFERGAFAVRERSDGPIAAEEVHVLHKGRTNLLARPIPRRADLKFEASLAGSLDRGRGARRETCRP